MLTANVARPEGRLCEGGNDLVNAGTGQARVHACIGDVVVKLASTGNLAQDFNLAGAAGADGKVSVSGSTRANSVQIRNGQNSVSLGRAGNVLSPESGS